VSARALWKGVIRCSDLGVPVSLYSRLQPSRLQFHLLHKQDSVRVRQRMVHSVTGEEVSSANIRKGWPLGSGTYVLVQPEDLAELEPPTSRDIEITRFVPPGVLEPAWLVRPYQLGPDGNIQAYFALAEAMRSEGRVGIARWSMRKRRYLGALSSDGEHLRLTTLRHAGEVVTASELEAPDGRALDQRELGLAEQLVSALAADFDPGQFRDEYRERVLELIAAKAQGHVVQLSRPEPIRPSEAPLANVLRASLRRAKARPDQAPEKISA
jgi:DNA end-binding protein Ku